MEPDFESFPVRLESTVDLTDNISSVVGEGTNATTAQIVQPNGLVTRFLFAPFPQMSVTPTETSITVSWPTEPNPTRLQYKDSPDPAVPWKDYSEPGIWGDDLLSLLEIPRGSLRTNRYFRLYWNSPQVGLPDTTIEIPAEPAPKLLIPFPTTQGVQPSSQPFGRSQAAPGCGSFDKQ